MPRFDLNRLGSDEFEQLSQSLVKVVIGNGSITFGPGPDGGREATFDGTAESYPSSSKPWSGRWLFQAKFHDLHRVSADKARQTVLAELESELDKTVNKYHRELNNYILITNVPITGVHLSGARDRIDRDIAPRYPAIDHIHVWGYDDIAQLLIAYPQVRQSYLHFITPGDILAELISDTAQGRSHLATTLRMYLTTAFSRDRDALLDQAGEVGEEPIRLERIFIDINASAASLPTRRQLKPLTQLFRYLNDELVDPDHPFSTLRLLLSDQFMRVVLIAGPGEGKSTIGQYLAQLHRAALLNRHKQLDPHGQFLPITARIPFRVQLKDYAQELAESTNADSLEHFLAEDVTKLSGRTCSPENIHTLLASNPVLLILDGLDEVMDPETRIKMLDRIDEFVTRCSDVLSADLQVVATSRPTAYSGQFSEEEYLHLTLDGLQPNQTADYVAKWTIARQLDEAKAQRLQHTMEACIRDPQISLLTNTPLQVTILILIILTGGTPPKQREALFNEYLEIIYKRERAKAPDLIRTERQLLFGLHQYIGYLLQRESATNQNVSSALDQASYEEAVRSYLRMNDPYSPSDQLDEQVASITREAGQRFVLLVEGSHGNWGFELRSIQEFFAAAHLTDTAQDSEERSRRFETICRSPHWRNVALFFAGRVGRQYAGEAANLVEVCRAVDEEGPDSFARRGSALALELAVDRAFGPRRRLQRSVIEYGLAPLDSSRSPLRSRGIAAALERLSGEDVRDHVAPLLESKLSSLASTLLPDVLEVATEATISLRSIEESLTRLIDSTNGTERLHAVLTALRYGVAANTVGQWLAQVVPGADAVQLDELASVARTHPAEFVRAISAAPLPEEEVSRVCAALAEWSPPHQRDRRKAPALTAGLSDWRGQLAVYLAVVSVLSRERERSLMYRRGVKPARAVPAELTSGPQLILRNGLSVESVLGDPASTDFAIPHSPVAPYLVMSLWALHLRWGDVTVESAGLFLSFVSTLSASDRGSLRSLMSGVLEALPDIDAVDLVPADAAADFLAKYCGRSGPKRWSAAWSEIVAGLPLEGDALTVFRAFGVHAPLPQDSRSTIEQSLQDEFGVWAPFCGISRAADLRSWDIDEPLVLTGPDYLATAESIALALDRTTDLPVLLDLNLRIARNLLLVNDETAAAEEVTARTLLVETISSVVREHDSSPDFAYATAMSLAVRNVSTANSAEKVLSELDVVGGMILRDWPAPFFGIGSAPSPDILSDVVRALGSTSGVTQLGAAAVFISIGQMIHHAYESPIESAHLEESVQAVRDLWRSDVGVLREAGLLAIAAYPPASPDIVVALSEAHGSGDPLGSSIVRTLRSLARRPLEPVEEWTAAVTDLLSGDRDPQLRSALGALLSSLLAADRFDIATCEADLHLPLPLE